MKTSFRLQPSILLCVIVFFVCSCGHGQRTSATEDSTAIVEQPNENEDDYMVEDAEEEVSQVVIKEALLALEPEEYYEQIYEDMVPTPREEKALKLANRVVTMYFSIDHSVPDHVWLWAEAVEQVVRNYAKESRLKYDTARYDLHEALSYYGYDIQTQSSMNTYAYYLTAIQTYEAAVRYQQLIDRIEDTQLKKLIRAEYNAWFVWMDAQYFTNTYYTHGNDHYSMLPLDLWSFHKYHTDNRLAVLNVEEEVLVMGKNYRQRGKTVTGKQWRTWLEEQGYREDMSPDFNMEEPTESDFPALIKDKTEKWIAARQAVAHYLGDKTGKGQSYDNLTADIHACMIGKLKPLVKMEEL